MAADVTLASLKVILCAREADLFYAWRDAFVDVDGVVVVQQNILSCEADAIVSPANSFGYMDGGIDLIYSQFLGWEVERRVRAVLVADHLGELPVGDAIIVPTSHERFPWLVSAPTMRVPMNVAHTVHAMLAFKAVLQSVQRHNNMNSTNSTNSASAQIRSVVCPGLGTGEGRMPARRCARQMRYAWDVVVDGRVETKGGLAGAVRNHQFLIGDDADDGDDGASDANGR